MQSQLSGRTGPIHPPVNLSGRDRYSKVSRESLFGYFVPGVVDDIPSRSTSDARYDDGRGSTDVPRRCVKEARGRSQAVSASQRSAMCA